MHVQMADEAYRIGAPPAAESYLLIDTILDVARRSGAEAIHPGYGFLSENAAFAEACQKAGIVFIGPPASAIMAMGSKSASKIIMTKAGVPVVPGYHGDDQDPARLKKEAERVGYPIMIKAVLGGGGKGMRIVRTPDEFDEALAACKREALASFKDDRVLIERFIQRPRHIEFQVFCDKFGNAVHLFERDCSVQRRHQKVLEEAPAPGMTSELRERMGKSACDAARAVGYVGAGTVEFIFDADTDEYFFMEMNTRLQVEHPVSEMITRRDFVQWQLHVAAGHRLPATQEEINAMVRGHALEARIYAENPNNNFLPATGRLVHLRTPTPGGDVRVETGVREGDEVSIFYDPMIAKLVVWGSDRYATLKRMEQALEQYQIVGPPNNIAFLQKAVTHPQFLHGKVTTAFIQNNLSSLVPKETTAQPQHVALAVLSLLEKETEEKAAQAAASGDAVSPWSVPSSFRLNGTAARKVTLERIKPSEEHDPDRKHDKHVVTVTPLSPGKHEYDLTFEDGATFRVALTSLPGSGEMHALVGGQAYSASVVHSGDDVHVFVSGQHLHFRRPRVVFGIDRDKHGAGAVSPMAGKVVKVLVHPGQEVKKGTPLIIMEAMKMEHVIRAPSHSVVEKVLYEPGQFVEGGKLMVTFASADKAKHS